MRYLSICSGIEAASVAWEPLGWTPAGFAEIDRFPSAVLAHHWSDVPNHGDFTTIDEAATGPVDLIVGGTPCQSFSVAGLRKGLDDERGNLALEFCLLARRLRPRWILWENVPGVLSMEGGEAFASILGGLVQCGYGVAYRVLDAQYFGLAQRRKRVFVVGHFGDWRRAAAVLFERESLSRNPPPRREKGQRTAPTISARPTGGGGLGTDFDCDGGLIASTGNVAHCLNAGGMGRIDYETETLVSHALKGEGFDASEDGTGRGTPLVPEPVAYRTSPNCGAWETGDRTDALTTATDPNSHILAFSCKDHGADAGDLSPSLRAMGHDGSHANAGGQVAVAFDMRGREGGAMPEGPHDTANLRAASGGSSRSYVATQWAVRRLTPREAERLQGFPDDFTLIDWSRRASPGKIADDVRKYYERTGYTGEKLIRAAMCPDGPRYKALGNSFAVPVVRWIGERIAAVDAIQAREEAA